jgi:hypothetical protein
VIAKVKVLPGDWFVFLHQGYIVNGSPDAFVRGQGLYGIFRQVLPSNLVDEGHELVDYCVVIHSDSSKVHASFERAAYNFFDNKVLYPQEKRPVIKRPPRASFHRVLGNERPTSLYQWPKLSRSAPSQPMYILQHSLRIGSPQENTLRIQT